MFYAAIAIVVAFIMLVVLLNARSASGPKQFALVRKMIETGNTKGAAKILKTILSKNEHNILAHWYLAEVYFQEHKNELAIVEYKYILRLNRYQGEVTEVKVHERLAELYEIFGQLDEAQKEYVLLTKLAPEFAIYYFKIGELFYKRNYTDKAFAYLAQAAKLNPGHPDTLFYLGIIHYSKGQAREALEYLNKALHFSPNMFKAHYYIGLIQRVLGMFDKARAEFQLAQRDPEFKLRALLESGRTLFQIENIRDAMIELERGISFVKVEDEVSTEMRYVLAACYEKGRDLPRAIEQWEIIENYRKGYKDVTAKLNSYADLRTDDKLKDFLTASKDAFMDMCKRLVVSMGFDILEVIPIDDDSVDFLATEQEGKWRNTKRSNRVVKIRRDANLVTELLVRQIQEDMKRFQANRGLILSTSGFSPSAMEYAATRPIDLIDRKQMTTYLKKI
jgi:tetratricopeptide (TPR) repeat protein